MKRPVVWLASLWAAGGVIALSSSGGLSWMLFLLIVMCSWLITAKMAGFHHALFAAGCLVLICSWGYHAVVDNGNRSDLLAEANARPEDWEGSSIILIGRMISPVQVDGDQAQFTLQAEKAAVNGSDFQSLSEKFKVFVRLQSEQEQQEARGWERGQNLALAGELKLPNTAGNFGEFDYRRYLRWQRIHWVVQADGAAAVRFIADEKRYIGSILRLTDRLREYLGKTVEDVFSDEQSGFMKSLILGLREDLPADLNTMFSKIGMSHILAISGLHVAVFVAACMFVLKLAGLPREFVLLTAMALIPGYVVLTGASPPVLRAGMMAVIALYALLKNRLKDGLSIIFAVGWLMLVINPYYLYSVSFQLSFIVTIGLIVGVPLLNQLQTHRFALLKNALSVTLTAQLASFPLIIYYFNEFSLLSWLANLLLVPLFSLIVIPVGMLALIVGIVSEGAGRIIARFAVEPVNAFSFWVMDNMNALERLVLIWPSPSPLWVLLYYALLLSVYALVRIPMPCKPYHALLLAGCAALFIAYAYVPESFQRSGQVQFLDVGQGDAILIRTPERQTILVDGGGTLSFHKDGEEWRKHKEPFEIGRDRLVPLLKKRGVREIDYLIATHGDADHTGGLKAVVEQLPVRRMLFNGTIKNSRNNQELFQAALAKNIPLYFPQAGAKLELGGHTALYFFHPDPAAGRPLTIDSGQNDQSVVFLMQMYDASFLFTGDIGTETEREILQRLPSLLEGPFQGLHLAPNVLKVAHHGSRHSTSGEWLNVFRPKVSVISVGKNNPYRHPSEEVLARLKHYRSAVFRTDRHGEVQFHVTEERIAWRSKRLASSF